MNAEDSSYDKNQQINTATLSKSLTKIRHKAIRQSGERFCAGLELVNEMLLLPSKLLALLHFERSVVFYDTKARIIASLSNGDYQEQYQKTLDRLIEEQFLPERDKVLKAAVEGGKHAFTDMLERNEMGLRETYETLLYSGIVWIWCGFEVLMRELWEYALNKGGKYLGGAVIKKLPSHDQIGDKIKSKYISLDYLAYYNYDLSKNLGTALLNKFDFTSCMGIREAYSCAFPKSKNIKDALCRGELDNLEATRNVIVHNAGIIDSTFCRRTQTNVTDIGKRLRLNNRNVSEYGNAVIAAGAIIIPAISSNLTYASKAAARK